MQTIPLALTTGNGEPACNPLLEAALDYAARGWPVFPLHNPTEFKKQVKTLSIVSPKQFFGIDLDSFGVELAKVTLMLAKKLALNEARNG